jgi:prepilin-type N-terminal cleavage/methylation domain-containing protein
MTTSRSRAFTLIELMMVVMIMTILFAILLSAVRTVQRHTLKTVTRGELKNLESAWKQYFSHYQTWPTNPPGYVIDASWAAALQGADSEAGINADRLVFMEFARLADGQPLNAWSESGRHDLRLCAYYVLFDEDGDNELVAPALAAPLVPPFSNTLHRGVAVWTYNPEARDAQRRPTVLGSWQ